MKKILFVLLNVLVINSMYSQSLKQKNNSYTIEWQDIYQISDFDGQKINLIYFENAIYNFPDEQLPYKMEIIPIPAGFDSATAKLIDVKYGDVTEAELKIMDKSAVPAFLKVETSVSVMRKKTRAKVFFVPLVKSPTDGTIKKVVSFKIDLQPLRKTGRAPRSNRVFTDNSVLRNGNWYKIGVTEDGVYKVSYDDLKNLGINVDNLASNSIRLFGNGGGMLPFENDKYRHDDLKENAIEIVDGGDGTFNSGDYLLFYGQNPSKWFYINGRFAHQQHLFTDTSYYFITTDYQIGTPKRIVANDQNPGNEDVTLDYFDDHQVYENDLVNFVKSGRNWYGESFLFKKSYSFPFSFPDATTLQGDIRVKVASRAIGRPSSFTISVDGGQSFNINFSTGVSGNYYADYALLKSSTQLFVAPSANFNVNITYNNPSSADEGWLDYIEITAKRRINLSGDQLRFRNRLQLTAGIVKYQLSGPANLRIWDVTDGTNVLSQPYTGSGGSASFKAFGGEIREYIAFTDKYFSTTAFGRIANQNLHSVQQADLVIVVYPDFISEAKRLADFREQHDQLTTVVVTTQQLYNEFSSGAEDITAIKDFMKMLYDRAGTDDSKMPKYLLLFGDASYDYKDRISGNTNLVPAYQSSNSHSPIGSYVSDDYVGFLDDSEGEEISNTLDIGVGRIMAGNLTQARDIVDKTIYYSQSPKTFGPWRTKVTFVGDDEDNSIHMKQSDNLAKKVDTVHHQYNINKIYLDAYQQIATAGGNAYPDVNIALDNAIETGTLLTTYVGHGGELGLAHEGILTLNQIQNYDNLDNLTVFLTATCEFSRFDDPARTSAGEFCLINPKGAASALFSTTRLVYSSPNYELSQSFFDHVFEKDPVSGDHYRIGDLIRIVKDRNDLNGTKGVNYRNFSILGDPALEMAYPELGVVADVVPDTVKSLQKITISGYVTDLSGAKATNFNGTVYPVIYDKKKVISTLNNDGHGVFKFKTQTSALFRGKASVKNGEFTFSFVVPKDIDFEYGLGRISFYAENGVTDAAGAYEKFQIGGRDGNPNADTEGPTVNLWMNDENFVIGGLTDQNPTILAKVFDDNGINTVGNGIGHDIIAILDENTSNAIILNDYYESELDSYQRGKISYKLSQLSEGKHTLTLKVWDVYNNSGVAYTEFYVSNNESFQIEHVLNYPNPFTTNTSFYFDHNANGQNLKVRIQVFTISGKLVKTIDYEEQTEGYRVGPIPWNGRDQYGDKIGKGTYIYKIHVTNSFGQTAEVYEKLVIL